MRWRWMLPMSGSTTPAGGTLCRSSGLGRRAESEDEIAFRRRYLNYALQKELNDLLKAQFGLRMQIATQQLSNTSQLKKVRRDIARVKTVLNTKEAK